MQHILLVRQSVLIQVTLHVCYLELNTKDVPSTVTEKEPPFVINLPHNQMAAHSANNCSRTLANTSFIYWLILLLWRLKC